MRMRLTWLASGLALSIGVAEFFAQGGEAIEIGASARVANVPRAAKLPLRHGVFRFSSYASGWTAAQKSNKPILVFATAPNCPHCVRMVGDTFRSPQISRFVNDSFETVYVDRVEQPEMAARLRVRWYPTTIIVGPNNQVLDVIEGYVDAKTLSQRLQTTVAAHAATQKR